MHGLKSAFKKLRHDGLLTDIERKSLRRFIDTYTTVSTHANTIGKVVAKVIMGTPSQLSPWYM